LINANDGVVLSSSVSLEWAPRRGPLALVAQSGALMGVLHARAVEQGIGLGFCVATGSQLQVRVEHLLAALSTKGEYLAVGAHIEDLDVQLFATAAESLAGAGCKLVVLKGGLTDSGSVAAAGHSGALAGDGRAFCSLAKELGVMVATHPSELLACMQAATVTGKSWCFATVSGGLAAIAADIASDEGLALVAPSPSLEVFPGANRQGPLTNPVDIDAVPMTTDESVAAVRALARDSSSDGVILVLNDKPDLEGLLAKLAALDEESRERLHLCTECSGQYDHAWRAWVAEGNTYARGLESFLHALSATRKTSRAPSGRAQAEGTLMADLGAHSLLAEAGIPVLALLGVETPERLEAIVSELKLPLVLKLAGAEHRGPSGVATVTSRAGARAEFERLTRIGDVLAQPLAQPGLEFYVGINVDPVFGPLFIIGAGGPALEEDQDVSMKIGLPDRVAIRRCIKETRSGRWLMSPLGGRLVDLELLVDVAHKAVALAERLQGPLVALDLNPVVLGPSGAMVVDAKVHMRKTVTSDKVNGL